MQNETRVSENLFSVQDDKQKGTPVHLPRLKVLICRCEYNVREKRELVVIVGKSRHSV